MPVFRKMLPTEMALYEEHLLRLSRADRYARFAGTVSDDVIRQHCRNLDWRRTIAVGGFVQGELRAAVVLCTDRLLWPDQAELAVSVEGGLQGQRAGTTLVRRALTIARNRSIHTVHMLVQAENTRMRALSHRFGGRMRLEEGEVSVTFDLPPPNQFSLGLEALEDGAGAVSAVLDRIQAAIPDRAAA